MSELAYAADFFMAHGHARDEDPPWPDPDDEGPPEDEADCQDEPSIIPPPL